MNVLFIAPGNSTHSHKWIETISSFDRSLNIHWYSLEPFLKPPSPHICSYTLPVSISFSLLRLVVFVICLIRNLILTKFQIVHIHTAGTYGLFALVCILFRIPYIITPWGSDIIFNSKNVVKRPLLLVALRNSIHITCDAQFVKDLALTLSPNSRVSVINFGIDTHFFTNPLRGSCQYPHSPQPIRLISNRNHEPVYNIETLIKAAKLFSDKGIPFQLDIAASGSLTPSLMALVNRLQLEKYVTFTGRYDYDTLPLTLGSHQIYISTSLSDAGISASIAEAMSCELVCIVSDSAENPLWITSGVNGFLYRTGSPESLYRSLLECLDSRDRWSLISKSARQTIVDRNDIYVEMKKAYQLLLSYSQN